MASPKYSCTNIFYKNPASFASMVCVVLSTPNFICAPCGYIREEDLIEQLVKTIDDLDLNEMHMRQKFEEEVARINKFQKNFFHEPTQKSKPKQIDLKDYAKYVLREGTMIEKREFLTCLRSKIVLANKAIKVVF